MKPSINQILSSLSNNGFLNLHNHQIKSFDTHGLLVRANVNNQLSKFYKRSDKFSHFLVNDLHDDIQHFLNRFLKLNSFINSFALVYKRIVPVQNDLILNQSTSLQRSTNDFNHSDTLNQLSSVNRCLAVFCNSEHSLNYFHWLQSQRHRFWRKLAANPSAFQMTNVKIDDNDVQKLNIVYKNDKKMNLDLETISYHKTLNHLNLNEDTTSGSLSEYRNNLDLIVCETNVDLSTLGLLCDSYNEKNNRQFMSLSEYLTPYQYAIIVIDSDQKLENRSKEFISYIFNQSKKMDLNIYPFVSFNSKDNLKFDSYDEIGVLYTILIEEADLDKGFLSLRNRDTDIIEKFHVTQLNSYMSLYAKLN